MDPVRVRVYGLFPLTKRRYLIQAVSGVVASGIFLAAWWFAAPIVREHLSTPNMPPPVAATAAWYSAVLEWIPWVVLAALVYKGIEVFFVLRAFARDTSPERERRG